MIDHRSVYEVEERSLKRKIEFDTWASTFNTSTSTSNVDRSVKERSEMRWLTFVFAIWGWIHMLPSVFHIFTGIK